MGFIATIITVIAKYLVADFHPFQIMFFYCALGAIALLPAVLHHYRSIANIREQSRTIRWRYHLLRSCFEFTGFSLTFYSILKLPLPMQTSLSYTTPIFASILAVLLLGETMTKTILISLILGTLGICIIHNPFGEISSDIPALGVGAALLAAVMFSMCAACIKLSTATTPPLLIAMIMLCFTAVIAGVFSISVWQAPTAEHIFLLVALGMLSGLVQFCVSKALTLGTVTKMVPLTYLNLVWASIFAYALFDELIDIHTILGSILIFSAVVFVSMRGRRTKKATL